MKRKILLIAGGMSGQGGSVKTRHWRNMVCGMAVLGLFMAAPHASAYTIGYHYETNARASLTGGDASGLQIQNLQTGPVSFEESAHDESVTIASPRPGVEAEFSQYASGYLSGSMQAGSFKARALSDISYTFVTRVDGPWVYNPLSSAGASSSVNMNWYDRITVTSDTLPVGTPVDVLVGLAARSLVSADRSGIAQSPIWLHYGFTGMDNTGARVNLSRDVTPPSTISKPGWAQYLDDYNDGVFHTSVGSSFDLLGEVRAMAPGYLPAWDMTNPTRATSQARVDGDFILRMLTPGADYSTESGQRYASERTPAPPPTTSGGSAADPIMPTTGHVFEVAAVNGETVFIDPLVAVGYDYLVSSGPNIQTVLLPDIGDGLFDLYRYDMFLGDYVFDQVLTQGVAYDFGIGGVDRFRIMGIEVGAGLDPNDPTAFVTGLTFMGTGAVNMSMTPISVDTGTAPVPEPGTWLLVGSGLLGLAAMRRRSAL